MALRACAGRSARWLPLVMIGAGSIEMNQRAAQALDQAEKTTSVEYIEDVTSAPRPWMKRTTQSTVYIQGAMYRSDYLDPGKDGVVALSSTFIGNTQTKQGVQVSYNRKTIEQRAISDAEAKHSDDAPEVLRHLAEHDAESLGDELLNGHKTLVFRVKKFKLAPGKDLQDDESVKVWIDPQTRLPVQIVIETWLGGSPGLPRFINREVMSNFKWNQPIDPKLFKVDAPAGFTKIERKPAAEGAQK